MRTSCVNNETPLARSVCYRHPESLQESMILFGGAPAGGEVVPNDKCISPCEKPHSLKLTKDSFATACKT